jgi:putative OPT family oligopeptide transporter
MSDEQGRGSTGNEEAECTGLSLGLGTLLAIIMGAANVYLGLKVGMTVSASIPAAVISMAVMRGVFKRGTILENNISQTIASTGESLAAGAIFTLPALLIAGVWDSFNFWISTGIILTGGLLGIVFMVPLRKALIIDRKDLKYPEGVACAEVLQVGQAGGAGIRGIVFGLGLGACFKLLGTGLGLLRGTVEGATLLGQRVFYVGADLSPALLAVGYIVGAGIASQIFLGGTIGWLVAIPLLGTPAEGAGAPLESAWGLWSAQVRYLGVGAMLVGGLYSIWKVRRGLLAGFQSLYRVSALSDAERAAVPRTERNMSFRALTAIFLLATACTFFLYLNLIGSLSLALVATAVMIPAAFLFTAVATYIVGLVGSSNSPVSGMTICALLLAVFVIWMAGGEGKAAMLATLGVAGVVCCVACSAGDVAQDLKTGQLVGSTPERQQWAEVLGVVVPAFFLTPVLALLHSAYGIGDGLKAPQATLFASLVEGFFGDGTLPYSMIEAGLGIGVAIIVLDTVLERMQSPFRLHIMPIAVGIYLPWSLSVPIMVGGLLHYAIARTRKDTDEASSSGILFGSGLIAGEALMGIALAIPLALGVKLALNVDAIPPGLLDFLSLLLFSGLVGYFALYARRPSTP